MGSVELGVQQIANRVDPQEAGLPPALINLLLESAISILSDCFHRQSGAAEGQTQAAFSKAYAENPAKLLQRTAYQVRKQARREGHKITKEQSLVLAKAIIAEASEPQNDTLFSEVVAESSVQED